MAFIQQALHTPPVSVLIAGITSEVANAVSRSKRLCSVIMELPSSFSMALIELGSDSNIVSKQWHSESVDQESMIKYKKAYKVPMVCLRHGGPPLPDVSYAAMNVLVLDSFNASVEGLQHLLNAGQCYPLQKKMTLIFTNEQISAGNLYVGLFNGIGPHRTQAKMVNRGSKYLVNAMVTVEGCSHDLMWGVICNHPFQQLSCDKPESGFYDKVREHLLVCRKSLSASCHKGNDAKHYTWIAERTVEEFMIKATNITFGNNNGTGLWCYARYEAMPTKTSHDYSIDLNKGPLVIPSPKIGRWNFAIEFVNWETLNTKQKLRYDLEWHILECPLGKAGPNCTWDSHKLKAIRSTNLAVPVVYFPNYLRGMPLGSGEFPLEPLLTNISSKVLQSDFAWTYFVVNVPPLEAGKNLHIQLRSDKKIAYETYARFGGLPSLNSWDYYYSNQTSSSNNDFMFKFYTQQETQVDLYIFYAREGTWGIGLRHKASPPDTTMSVSIKTCPNECSGHGKCNSDYDGSHLTIYGFCYCDQNYGGFDCSIQTVSPKEQIIHSVLLVASNAASLLPALWSLRQKAYAEWVIFMCSGISSGIYHACDAGDWCLLSYYVLRFMDFWLSFVAVVCLFLYLTALHEAVKSAMTAVVFITTALMYLTGPTRSTNIVAVLGIGALGLLLGWFIEFSIKYKSQMFSTEFSSHVLKRLRNVKTWLLNPMKTLSRRFRWDFVALGFITLFMAGLSWTLETAKTYWLWHSTWHVSIYGAAFLFLCSKAPKRHGGNHERDISMSQVSA
ncbi:NGX6/PGAP6/MYMK [Dillenia turbinata]|uniref:NGX6/PGAP6/MYMK n=1 Tax=Dillenia turbinata TaxID=194707 RepID=A0AAN8ZIE7_9MAGN